MSFIQKTKLFFHQYFLRKQLKQFRRPNRTSSLSFEDAVAIGILFNATELDNRKIALKYAEKLKKSGKKVKLLGFFDNEMENENFTFDHFNSKQLDWALRPKSEAVAKFVKQSFDFLINIDPQSSLYSEYITAFSHAHLKVGPFTEQSACYDLTGDAKSTTNTWECIKHIEFLLEKTNTKHAAAQI